MRLVTPFDKKGSDALRHGAFGIMLISDDRVTTERNVVPNAVYSVPFLPKRYGLRENVAERSVAFGGQNATRFFLRTGPNIAEIRGEMQ